MYDDTNQVVSITPEKLVCHYGTTLDSDLVLQSSTPTYDGTILKFLVIPQRNVIHFPQEITPQNKIACTVLEKNNAALLRAKGESYTSYCVHLNAITNSSESNVKKNLLTLTNYWMITPKMHGCLAALKESKMCKMNISLIIFYIQ